MRGVLAGYRSLLGTQRGFRTYAFVLWNGIFHSGVFTWLGLYFAQRYGLGEVGIGLAILGYGIPGVSSRPSEGARPRQPDVRRKFTLDLVPNPYTK